MQCPAKTKHLNIAYDSNKTGSLLQYVKTLHKTWGYSESIYYEGIPVGQVATPENVYFGGFAGCQGCDTSKRVFWCMRDVKLRHQQTRISGVCGMPSCDTSERQKWGIAGWHADASCSYITPRTKRPDSRWHFYRDLSHTIIYLFFSFLFFCEL